MSDTRYFYLRSNNFNDLVQDVIEVVSDPYEIGLLLKDINGDIRPGYFGDMARSGEWIKKPAKKDSNHNEVKKAVMGDHVILNLMMYPDRHIEVINTLEELPKADHKLHPDDVDSSKKMTNGTHRINKPSTPVRQFTS